MNSLKCAEKIMSRKMVKLKQLCEETTERLMESLDIQKFMEQENKEDEYSQRNIEMENFTSAQRKNHTQFSVEDPDEFVQSKSKLIKHKPGGKKVQIPSFTRFKPPEN